MMPPAAILAGPIRPADRRPEAAGRDGRPQLWRGGKAACTARGGLASVAGFPGGTCRAECAAGAARSGRAAGDRTGQCQPATRSCPVQLDRHGGNRFLDDTRKEVQTCPD